VRDRCAFVTGDLECCLLKVVFVASPFVNLTVLLVGDVPSLNRALTGV
jgi:hypothetical protein